MKHHTMPRIFNKAPGVIQPDNTWYRIKNLATDGETPGIEVYIYGEIGYWGVTANDFLQDLRALDDGVSPVTVAFNTIGGDLFDGLAIHNALNRLGDRCTARIDALAASAGSVAACGAHRVVMAANSMLMIHNPWTYAQGDSDDLRRVADVLDQTLEAIIASYKRKAPGIDDAELRQMVSDETWLTAAEALTLGLADEVIEGVEVKASLGPGAALRRYQNTPQTYLDQLDAPTTADPAPEPQPKPEPAPEPEPVAAALAARLTRACSDASISHLAEALIMSSKLKDDATVDAEIVRAKAVRDLCVSARLPELATDYVKAGLDAAAVRARLFDKLVGSGFGEINNKLPAPDEKPDAPKPKAASPAKVYADRKAKTASTRKSKPSKGEA